MNIFAAKKKNETEITPEEFEQFEKLLGKLLFLFQHDYCIVPNQVQDGFHIAIYGKGGKVIINEIGPTLESVVKKCVGILDKRI